MLAELFIDSWQGLPPERLVLDIDSTDDPVHGRQEGRFYHGYYGHYCLLPLYILCAGRPLFAQLKPGNAARILAPLLSLVLFGCLDEPVDGHGRHCRSGLRLFRPRDRRHQR